jgi:hypothetical protein
VGLARALTRLLPLLPPVERAGVRPLYDGLIDSRINDVQFHSGSTCPRFEEFDDRPSLQKIPELVDSESAGLEESGATRIFNGFESLLIPGGRPNSMEFAISQACRLSKERPVRICSFFFSFES